MPRLGTGAVVLVTLGCHAGVLAPPTTTYIASQNGLSLNGLTTNGMKMNGLRLDGLGLGGLHVPRFAFDGSTAEPSAQVMRYVVGCALAQGHTITIFDDATGAAYSFAGALGLADGWADRGLDPDEEEWISACLMAHANAIGLSVPISVRGNAAGLLVSMSENQSFGVSEGVFFGNLFANPPELHVCAGTPGWDAFFIEHGRGAAYDPARFPGFEVERTPGFGTYKPCWGVTQSNVLPLSDPVCQEAVTTVGYYGESTLHDYTCTTSTRTWTHPIAVYMSVGM
jgi:hypothetical protein